MTVPAGWKAVRLEELDSIPLFEGLVWHPVRRRLGIRAFGMNAYTSERPGETVVEEHDETGGGAGGHEEVYLVLSGRATFTVGRETQDAPAGTFVFVSDPALKRRAVAEEEGTVVLAVGGEPGRAYEVSAWEYYFAAMPAFKAERWDEAIALMQEGLEEKPGNPALLYNLACAESRAGRAEEAVGHLQQAVASDGTYAGRARDDSDLDPIRTLPGFPA
jgi:tetratricopeptide (TPR) repeat protein